MQEDGLMACKYNLDDRNKKLLQNYGEEKNYLAKHHYQRLRGRKKNNTKINLREKGCEDVGSG
jgi:hypothetical protein